MALDLSKVSDEELKLISSGNLKDLSEDTLRLISGATPPAGSAPPIGMAAVPAIEEQLNKDFEEKRAELIKDQKAKEQEITTTSPFTLPGFLSSPVVTGAGLLAAGYGVGRYGPEIAEKTKGAYKSIKERFISNPVEAPVRIEPIGFESFANMEPVDQPAVQAIDKLQRAEQLAEANRQLGIGGNQPVAPGPIVRGQLPENNPLFSSSPKAPNPVVPPQFPPAGIPAGDIPPAPPYMPSTPLSSAPDDAPAPKPSSGPGSFATTIIVDEVKDMIQNTPDPTKSPELRTGTGKPAFGGIAPPPKVREKGGMAGKPIFRNTYARPEDVPAGYAFVPNAQFIDPGRQDMGQPLFTKTYMAQDYPLTDKMAREQAGEINRMLGKPTRTELKAAGLEPAPNTPGITQYINQPKGSGMGTKTVRVGGTLGALVAIPDLAKAETAGQRGMAAANLLEAILPPGFMMGGAGAGSDIPPSMAQAMLLGSPYAQTEFAKKQRQEQEYVRKVGAGRGIAPPSAYQR
jgi:hypothetical protein